MVFGKKVAIFDWEWGRRAENRPLEKGRKCPGDVMANSVYPDETDPSCSSLSVQIFQIHIGSTLFTLNIWPFKAPHNSLSLNPVTPEQHSSCSSLL